MHNIAPLKPYDEFNQQLQQHVHPGDWVNPQPQGRYNLVVIGAGTAGLVTAAGAAGLGAKVALIERDLMGGDCLNVGCVPSKGVISAARIAATIKQCDRFGISVPDDIQIDFAAVMQRMRKLRAGIASNDSAIRFRDLGVDVYLGQGQFTSRDTITVEDRSLKFSKAVVATGARAAELPIPGLKEINALTNETLFSLTDLPPRLAVIGGGPIGCEMAQTFARFGSEVTLFEQAEHILIREDADAAHIVQQALVTDGVQLQLNSKIVGFENQASEKIVRYDQQGETSTLAVDEVLVAIGRQPNVETLQLENVGVAYDPRDGIQVNDRLQTTNVRIFAAGDVCSRFKFTHAADFMARTVIQNALFLGRAKASALTIPWCTYTTPELAHIGLSEQQAAAQNREIDTYRVDFDDVDRAILDGETEGFVKIHCAKGSDKIVGATIVATNAGDMIGSLSIAMTNKVGLGSVAKSIHPYPTQAEAIRKAGDLYNRTRLTPFVKRLFNSWLSWSR